MEEGWSRIGGSGSEDCGVIELLDAATVILVGIAVEAMVKK